jgi:predicted Zn-dependent peptidase
MKTKVCTHLPFRKRAGFGIILLLVIVLTIVPGYIRANDGAESSQPSLTANVIKKVYNNGLTLLIKPNYDNDIVAFNLFLRMGPLYEQPSQKGISSLMQRCLLYGGTTNRNLPDIYQELESVGATWEYAVSSNCGNVWFKVARSGFDKALDVFFDIICNPKFNNGDLKTGKSEKIQNIKTRGDQPFNIVSSAFMKSFYGDHPYSWITDGSVETIESLTRKDLIEWHQKTYIPNNMVFTIVGNVNPDEIIKKFEDTFGNLKKGKLPEKSSEPIPELDGDLVSVHPKNIQGAYLFLGYPAPEILNDDVPAMVLLNTILGGSGMNNRLYTELRDQQGLAYYVASYYQPMVGPTSIFAVMVTAPENYRISRAGIVAEFKKFCDQPVSVKELEAAKKYIKGTFMMSQETSAAQGILLGLAELRNNYQYLEHYLELIEKVTPEDIQRVAQKYFKYYVLAVVAPEGSVEE